MFFRKRGPFGAAPLFVTLLLSVALLARPTGAAPLPGDLTGDGVVDAADEAWLVGFYGSEAGDPGYEPVADLTGDGVIDVLDLGLFGAGFGASGGDVDTTPPGLLVTLADIPDDMNDLLVAPPDGFQITLHLDSAGGSVIDPASLSVTSDQDMGPHLAGAELASQFTLGPTRAVWEVPAGSGLARTSHYLTVSVSDVAGNPVGDVYGYAVRDFGPFGQPLANLQTVFLDFDQDRGLQTGVVDFVEDLRSFGLTSATPLPGAEGLEAQLRDTIVGEIVMRAHPYYGRNPDGSPGPDAVNLGFTAVDPGPPHTRLCVGGESFLGAANLGGADLDLNNATDTDEACDLPPVYGVFPQAIDNLWGSDPSYQAAFAGVRPGLGGTPVGEDPLDAVVLAAGFDPASAPAAEVARYGAIAIAVDAFAQVVATAAAHETGHLLGLTAPGSAPGGLFGGISGPNLDHNVTPGGATPAQSFLMNAGGSFSFDEMTGRSGVALPIVRALNWAYLRDRIVLNGKVTGLYPAPTLQGVAPNPANPPVQITITGTNFLLTPQVELIGDDQIPRQLLGETLLSYETLTAWILNSTAPPGVYDVRVTNPDDQVVVLVDGVEIQ